MAKRISPEKAASIRRLYAQCGTYAVVARLTKCSASTVARIIRETSADNAVRRETPRA